MKKLILAVLIVAVLPWVAGAQTHPPEGYPTGTEVLTWWWNETAFVQNPAGGGDARLFVCVPLDSSCNKNWKIPVKMHASIAQWVKWNMNGSRWYWFVRKPGNYAGNCMTWQIASNQNVLINYEGFGPLIAEEPDKAIYDTIWAWYGVGDVGTPPPKGNPWWVRADSLNYEAEWDTIFDSAALHAGIFFKIWNYIHVVECNSACEYQSDAFVTVDLLCQKDWIDTETGGYFGFGD